VQITNLADRALEKGTSEASYTEYGHHCRTKAYSKIQEHGSDVVDEDIKTPLRTCTFGYFLDLLLGLV
jgi:hypothetical protein